MDRGLAGLAALVGWRRPFSRVHFWLPVCRLMSPRRARTASFTPSLPQQLPKLHMLSWRGASYQGLRLSASIVRDDMARASRFPHSADSLARRDSIILVGWWNFLVHRSQLTALAILPLRGHTGIAAMRSCAVPTRCPPRLFGLVRARKGRGPGELELDRDFLTDLCLVHTCRRRKVIPTSREICGKSTPFAVTE